MSRRSHEKSVGDECIKFEFGAAHADMSILGCGGQGLRCFDDDTSSTGGRCGLVDETSLKVQHHRELAGIACTYANGTAGVKCNGAVACTGLDTSIVGCGSCNG